MDKLKIEYQSQNPQSDYREKLYEYIKSKKPNLLLNIIELF